MSDPGRSVESLLADLADHIDWPEPTVRHFELTPRLARPRPERSRAHRWVSVTAALTVLVALLLVLSPQAREAVADLLGVAGIEIEFRPVLEEPLGAGLGLGRETSLEEAVASVDFPVSIPEQLGEPDAVYLFQGRINMVWQGGEALPAAGDSEVGLLYSQFRFDGDGDRQVKSLGPESVVIPIEVAGWSGFWIEGATHLVSIEDASGRWVEETLRLAGNVLMWETDHVTHRLETMLGLDEALGIAESIRQP
ncbi:MAG TPA: hypothetical protein VK990_01115 [Acidimicrobiia bacterium]|nr:hypothetical protein [Acidimicrobiia bacterium]